MIKRNESIKIHLRSNKRGKVWPACGQDFYPHIEAEENYKMTDKPDEVTCKNCKRTKEFVRVDKYYRGFGFATGIITNKPEAQKQSTEGYIIFDLEDLDRPLEMEDVHDPTEAIENHLSDIAEREGDFYIINLDELPITHAEATVKLTNGTKE